MRARQWQDPKRWRTRTAREATPGRASMAAAASVALALVLAGCMGGGASPEDGAGGPLPLAPGAATGGAAGGGEGSQSGAPAAGAAHREDLAPLRFAAPGLGDEAFATTQWFNGSFALQEHSWPKGQVTRLVGAYDPDRRVIDVAEWVPRGFPVLLRAEVQADLGMGDVDLWFQSDSDGVFWTTWADAPFGGHTRIGATVVLGQADALLLNLRYDEVDDSTGFDYTLRFDVLADPWLLPDGVPVAADLPGNGAELQFSYLEAEAPHAVFTWDPRDRFLARSVHEGAVALDWLPQQGPAGSYVLMLAEGSGPARVAVRSPDPMVPVAMRPLTQEIVFGSDQSASAGATELAWAFESQRVPLQAGLFWEGNGASLDTAATLAGPEGTLVDLAFASGEVPWLLPGFGWLTDMGVEGLAIGAYEAHVAFGQPQPQGITAREVLVYWSR